MWNVRSAKARDDVGTVLCISFLHFLRLEMQSARGFGAIDRSDHFGGTVGRASPHATSTGCGPLNHG